MRQPTFVASPRLSAFLRYIVEEALAGRSARLKAFSIAMTVFGRGEDFDPQRNSLVRVEAMRLRQTLSAYYSAEGGTDAVEIRLRPGSYAPEFVRRGVLPSPPPLAATAFAPTLRQLRSFPADRRILLEVALAGVAVASLVYGLMARRASDDSTRAAGLAATRPTIAVESFSAPTDRPDLRAFAGAVRDGLEISLSRFEDPVVLRTATAQRPTYQLAGSLSPGPGGTVDLGFSIAHSGSGEIVWAREFTGFDIRQSAATGQFAPIAATLSQTYGVIAADQRRRLGPNRSPGYQCVLQAQSDQARPDEAGRAQSLACLDETISIDPNFHSAYTEQAFLRVDSWLQGEHADWLALAVAAARRAVQLAPQKGRPHTALFWALLFAQRFDEAWEEARVSLDLNPWSTDTLGRAGAAHILRGDLDVGEKLIQRAASARSWTTEQERFFLFLVDFVKGDAERAARHARGANIDQFALNGLAQILADPPASAGPGAVAWNALATHYPDVARDVTATFDRYAMTDSIKERLVAALKAAGVPPDNGVP